MSATDKEMEYAVGSIVRGQKLPDGIDDCIAYIMPYERVTISNRHDIKIDELSARRFVVTARDALMYSAKITAQLEEKSERVRVLESMLFMEKRKSSREANQALFEENVRIRACNASAGAEIERLTRELEKKA